MISDIKYKVLPSAQAWSTELCRITSGSPQKMKQDRRPTNNTQIAETQVAIEDPKLKLKKDLITFAQNWKKQHVSIHFHS